LTADSATAKLSNPGGGVTAVVTGAVADGESENKVKITVTDTYGNGVSGKEVTLTADNSAVIAASATTGSDGSVTVAVTGKKSGKTTVKATLDKINAQASVNFVAGAADTSKSSLAVSPDTIVANNTAESAITLTLRDVNDNPVSGQSVVFESSLDSKKTTISEVTDNGDGTYSATIKGTLAGRASITVKVNNNAFAVAGKTVRLIGDSSKMNTTKSVLSVSPDTIVANNTAESTITLALNDDNDNGVIGQTVAFSTTLDNTKTTISSVTDNDDGTYSATIKGTLAGNAPVAVKVNNKTFSVTGKTVVLTPDASGVSAEKSSLTVSDDSIVADNTAESTITLTLKDAHDNLVSGQSVAFESSLDSKKTTISEVTDNSDGTYSATIKGTLAGKAAITVKVNNNAFAVTGKTVTLTADSTTAKLSNPGGGVTAVVTGAVADGESENKVKITVTDTYGNGVSGQTVTLTADNSAVIAASATTGSDGSVTVPVTTKKAGSVTVKATLDKINAQASVNFVADTPVADKSSLAVSPDSIVADNTAESAITLTLKDANDNPATGLTVAFESSLDSKKTTISEVEDNGNGTYSATLKGTLAGKADITVKVGGESFAVTGKTVTLTADSATAKLSNPGGGVTAVVTGAVADGESENKVKITVTDTYGNGVSGKEVTLTADNSAVIAASATTGSDGSVTVAVTGKKSGKTTVKATLDKINAQASVNFVADTPVVAKSSLAVSPASIVADDTKTSVITLTLKDVNENPVTGQAVTFATTLDNEKTTISKVTDNGDGTYSATIKGTLAGKADITVKVGGESFAVTGKTVTLTADSSTAKLTNPEAGFSLQSTAAVTADGTSATVAEAVVTDAYGNPVPDFAVSFSAGGGAVVSAAQVKTDSTGTAVVSVTSLKAGTVTVRATVNNETASVSATFTADADSGKITNTGASLRAIANNAPADDKSVNKVKAVVTDQYGNPVSRAKVSFTATNNATLVYAAEPDDDGFVTTGGDGSVIVSVRSAAPGTSTVTATVNDSSASVIVTFTGDLESAGFDNDGSGLSVLTNNVFADGVLFNRLKITLKDSRGNPVPEAEVSLSGGTGVTLSSTAVTGTDGTVVVSAKSTTVGTYTITASYNDTSATADVTFTPVVNASLSSVSVPEGPFYAGGDGAAVTLTLYDTTGELIKNASVYIYVAYTNVPVTSTTKNNGDGTYSATVTSDSTGTYNVKVSVSGVDVGIPDLLLTFVTDTTTAALSSPGAGVSVTSNNNLANGSAQNKVTITVTNARGKGVGDQEVTVSATNGAVVTSPVTTGSDGTVTVPVTSSTAGVSTVTAAFNGETRSADVTFLHAPDTKTTTVTVSESVIQADGSDTAEIILQPRDARGDAITQSGYTVIFTSSLTGVTIGSVTYQDGTYRAPLSSKVAGEAVISATVNNYEVTGTATVTVSGVSSSAAVSALTVTSDNAAAGGTAENRIKAVVTDISGNAVAGYPVSFTADNGASVVSSAVTGTDGSVTVAVTGTKAGVVNVTASTSSTSAGTATRKNTVTFVADTATAKVAAFTVAADKAYADGTDKNSLKVTVTDANGNALSGITVTLAATNGAVIASSVTSGSDGSVAVTLTNTTAGASTVTATAGGVSLSREVTFITPFSGSLSGITAAPAEIAADGKTASEVTLTLKTTGGVPVSDAAVSFVSSLKGVDIGSVTNKGGGTYTASLTTRVAGDIRVSAVIDGRVRDITPAAITATGAAAEITMTGEYSGIEVLTGDAPADGTTANTVKITLADAFGNPASGKSVTLTATNGAVVSSPVTTGADGTVTVPVTSKNAGVSNITATYNGSASAEVSFALAVSDALSSLTLTKSSILADNSESSVVQWVAVDYNGKALTGLENAGFNLSDGSYITLGDVTETPAGSGTYKASLKGSQAKVITVTPALNGVATGKKTVSLTLNPPVITEIHVAGYGGDIQYAAPSGTAGGFPSTVYENRWTNKTTWFRFSAAGGDARSNSAYTWTSDQSWVRVSADGVVTFTAKPTSATKTVTITATYPGYETYTYKFTVSKWFTQVYGYSTYPEVSRICSNRGGIIPALSDLVHNKDNVRARYPGTLYGEWGGNVGWQDRSWTSTVPDGAAAGTRYIWRASSGAISTDTENNANREICMFDY
ncbi:invasin domain 3-containing protein, partial [Morganella morganii]|uniref:Ig-like domain-containing protein n=1 Tax=Morganella morganii TaxID=582 RepID=UPI003EBBBE30